MSVTRGTSNGSPKTYVLGLETWFNSAQLNVEDLAIVGSATAYSNEMWTFGSRNLTVYFDPGTIGGTFTILLQTLMPNDMTTVVRETQIAAGLTGSGWLAYDLGIGTLILPGAVFGLSRIRINETAGNPGAVSAFVGARH